MKNLFSKVAVAVFVFFFAVALVIAIIADTFLTDKKDQVFIEAADDLDRGVTCYVAEVNSDYAISCVPFNIEYLTIMKNVRTTTSGSEDTGDTTTTPGQPVEPTE